MFILSRAAMLRLYEPTAGRVIIDGDDVATLSPEALRKNPLGVFVNALNWSKELSQ